MVGCGDHPLGLAYPKDPLVECEGKGFRCPRTVGLLSWFPVALSVGLLRRGRVDTSMDENKLCGGSSVSVATHDGGASGCTTHDTA